MNKILVILLLLLFLIIGCKEGIECRVNSDCVPAACCHADSCIAKENAPDCEGAFCSMECKPYTMDCGQGSCICENNKCAVNFNN